MKHTIFAPALGLLTSLFLFAGYTQAQQTPNFELAERFTAENMQNMTGSTFLNARWIEDEDRFW